MCPNGPRFPRRTGKKGSHNMIKLLVDSASDCRNPSDLGSFYIPITLNIDGREYQDGIDIDSDTFYRLLMETKCFPTTSQPSPQAFLELFEGVRDRGEELIYLALSSALSGTYQNACMARSMVGYDGIHIIDTRAATHMIGILAEYAAGLIREGHSAQEIVQQCEAVKSKIHLFAGLDTLEYLRRGGRLGRVSAAVGELAGIKPVITVMPEGDVASAGKCLGRGKAMQLLVEKLRSYPLDERFPIWSLYTYGEENCQKLEEKMAAAGYPAARRLQVGPTIGAHVGPGAYAVLFVEK